MHFAPALANKISQTKTHPASSCTLPHPRKQFEIVSITIEQDFTKALFFARHDCLITSRFPGFERDLLKVLPHLLDNVKCFNGHNHHFATEMLATETGHLFEHIWLEVLCGEKLKTCRKAHYAGETSWNWRQDPRGLFRIHINAGVADKAIIEKTAFRSLQIMEQVLQ